MMQRWKIVVLLGTTLLGCQVDRTYPGSEVTQPLRFADACQATLPPSTIFDGKTLPKSEPGEIWVVVPSTQGEEMTAALVNTEKATIPFLTVIPKGMKGTFLNDLDNAAQVLFPGHPNPPPPVIDPDLLVLYAQQTAQAIDLAERAAANCKR
jgi:hypothetical protein